MYFDIMQDLVNFIYVSLPFCRKGEEKLDQGLGLVLCINRVKKNQSHINKLNITSHWSLATRQIEFFLKDS